MTTSFFVCWLPYAALCFFSVASAWLDGGAAAARLLSPAVAAFPILCAKSSVVLNPALYILFNDEVRRLDRHIERAHSLPFAL